MSDPVIVLEGVSRIYRRGGEELHALERVDLEIARERRGEHRRGRLVPLSVQERPLRDRRLGNRGAQETNDLAEVERNHQRPPPPTGEIEGLPP